MRITVVLIMGLFLLSQAMPQYHSNRVIPVVVVPPVLEDGNNDENFRPEVLRRSYRSPRSGYTGGTRSGINPGTTDRTGRRTGVNDPAARTPNVPTNRFGGFFGGILAGTFLGSLLNPFGFGGTGGFSIIGILFWAVILYVAFRFLRRLFRGAR